MGGEGGTAEDRDSSRVVKGRDEEHGGKRIGLAWKMGGIRKITGPDTAMNKG